MKDTIERQAAALTQKAAGILEKGFATMGERAGKGFAASLRKGAEGAGKDLSGTLEKSVSGVGKAAADSVEKSVAGVGEAAAGTVEKVVSGAGKAVTETVEKSVSEAGKAASDSVEKVVSDVGAKATETVDKAVSDVGAKAEETIQQVFDGGKYIDEFEADTASFGEKLLGRLREISQKKLDAFNLKNVGDDADEIDFLERKMENILEAIDLLGDKIAELSGLKNVFPADSIEGKKIAEQLNSAERAMLSLEQRSQQTRDRLSALMDGRIFSSWGEAARYTLGHVAEVFGEMEKEAGSLALGGVKKLGSGIKSLSEKCMDLGKKGVRTVGSLSRSMLGFSKNADKGSSGVRSFSARLRNIVSGALIFNGLSSALRGMTSRLGEAVTGTSQMKTALANLQGAAATAAAPLLTALTPALSAIANAAATAFSYLAKLISLLTGKSVGAMQSAAKSMEGYGSSAGGAAKKVRDLEKANNSLGLDELNVIDPQDDPDSGSGGGGGGAEDVAPDFSFEGKSPFLDSVLEAIRGGDYTQVGVLFAEKLNGIVEKINWAPIDKTLTRWANHLADGLNGFVDTLDWKKLGNRLVGGVNTGLHAVDAFFQRFNWRNLGKGLAEGLSRAVTDLDAAALGRVLTDKLRAGVEMLYGFVTTFQWGTLGLRIAQAIDSAFGNIDWATAGQGVSGLISGLLDTALAFIAQTDWGKIGKDVGVFLCNIDWGDILLKLGFVILEAAGALLDLCGGFFEELATHCGDGFFGGLFAAFADVCAWLKANLVDPLVNGIKELLGIHSPSTVFSEIGEYLVLGLFNGLSNAWGSITRFFSESLSAITEKVSAAWDNVKEKTLGVWTSLKTGIKSRINDIIRVMNGLISGAANMINRMIDVLNGFSIDVPEWAQSVVGTDRFGFNIQPVSAPQIPMLAQGGYVGPNQPQLAIIGDNRREGEIVAPESKIAEAVAAGLAAGGSPGVGNAEMLDLLMQILEVLLRIVGKDTSIQLDGEVLGRAVTRWMQNRGASVGGSFAEAY